MKSLIILYCVCILLGISKSLAYPQDDREVRQVEDVFRQARDTKAAKPKAANAGSNVILLENEKTGQDILLIPKTSKREAFPFPDEDEIRDRRNAYPGDEDELAKREANPYPYPYAFAQDDI